MRTVVLTTHGDRPHVEHPSCWCRPAWVVCTCDADCGAVLGHKDPLRRGDPQPRMSVFSEQYVRGLAPEST